MANAFVQSQGSKWFGGQGTTESVTLTVTAGSLLVIGVGWNLTTASITSVAGNGNTYTLIDARTDGTAGKLSTYYAMNAASGSTTVTVTWGIDPGYGALAVHEVSGADLAAALDQHATAIANAPTTAANAITTGNVTTTTAGQYIFGFVYDKDGGTTTLTAGTNYTKREAQESIGASEDQIQAGAGAIAVTFTTSDGFENYLVGVATFKAAGGGGGAFVPYQPAYQSAPVMAQ